MNTDLGAVLSREPLPEGGGAGTRLRAGAAAGDGAPGRSAAPRAGQALAAAWYRFAEWIADGRKRARQRRQLARLDDRMLKDIGLSRADVHQETRKPFWQA